MSGSAGPCFHLEFWEALDLGQPFAKLEVKCDSYCFIMVAALGSHKQAVVGIVMYLGNQKNGCYREGGGCC